ncbi:MAG: hypothetical protein O7E52_15325 [Candidatus Poribacteria bacterium]|nr:hypothetical protein [Candidatus Poribacteria bacterium]
MSNLKITFVGGGSFTWAPRLACNIMRNTDLKGAHVVLYDLNPEALALSYRLIRKYKDFSGAATTFEQTTDRAAALDGTSIVVVTISTGGLRTMKHDLAIPEKYGIFHTVGDTTGPAGLSRNLRNIPVFLDLARAMEKHCPHAWMINCSNPLSALTRVVNRETAIGAVGFCHGVPSVGRSYARFLNAEIDDCAYVNTGIDHCSWFTHFIANGKPALAQLIDKGLDDWLALPPDAAQGDPSFGDLYALRCGLMLGRRFNALPAIGDRHMVEFFPTFINGLDNVQKYGLIRTAVAQREKNAAAARDHIERQISGDDALDFAASGDEIATWMAALNGGPVVEDNLSAPNIGQIPQLPADAVVETRGILDATGFRPLVSPMPDMLEAMVRPHVLRDELTVDAALEGSFEKALAVLTTDPLVADRNIARPMLEELIATNKDWLPQF